MLNEVCEISTDGASRPQTYSLCNSAITLNAELMFTQTKTGTETSHVRRHHHYYRRRRRRLHRRFEVHHTTSNVQQEPARPAISTSSQHAHRGGLERRVANS